MKLLAVCGPTRALPAIAGADWTFGASKEFAKTFQFKSKNLRRRFLELRRPQRPSAHSASSGRVAASQPSNDDESGPRPPICPAQRPGGGKTAVAAITTERLRNATICDCNVAGSARRRTAFRAGFSQLHPGEKKRSMFHRMRIHARHFLLREMSKPRRGSKHLK